MEKFGYYTKYGGLYLNDSGKNEHEGNKDKVIQSGGIRHLRQIRASF